ncbi:MAG: NUDIX domain-containing protein [Candidatus Hermodarchaeota archaeon]
MSIIEKVFAYITMGNRLLAFTERGFEHFGLQVPAGSKRKGEPLELAVLREAKEETGLKSYRLVKHLGTVDVEQTEYGLDETHRRHFFHLVCEEETPQSWSHVESDPSRVQENTPEAIFFDIHWIPLSDDISNMADGHNEFLENLRGNFEQ